MTTSSWQQVECAGSQMRLHVSVPEGSGPYPAVVVAHHQGGVDEFVQAMTKRFAQAGLIAAAPDLYHRDGPDCRDDAKTRSMRLRDKNVIADINSSVSFLQQHKAVAPARVGITGFCMGGRIVYLMAAVNPDLKAAVAYYGGNIFRAWGKEIPSPFERTAQIYCPLLGHFGMDDKNPSPEDMQKLDAELTKFNKPHEFYAYENAGHAFMDQTKESYRRHADESSWPRTLNFLERYLVGSAT
ncbi:MAG: dienelactone hydrolase family protein [Deltaproteobacteria bacterium]|nr:dienelactone hydrolase family protein [Deltaproteobacteria bacterium]